MPPQGSYDAIASAVIALIFLGMTIWGVFCYGVVKYHERRERRQ
jgi:hypothetical protein